MRRVFALLLLATPAACTTDLETAPVTEPSPRPVLSEPRASSEITVADPTDNPSSAASAPPASLQAALALLRVEDEHVGGYDRELFRHWSDGDGDGCDTRCEVLAAERLSSLPGLPGGGWLSAYDGYSTDDPGELDIDHLVPLAEAYESGAHAWGTDRREEFANDLGSPASLIAVTAATNRAKGARDPAEWQPPRLEHWCTYVSDWVTVKMRWDLSVDPAELRALSNMSTGCTTVFAMPAVETTSAPSATTAGDESFANCAEARAAGRTPLRSGETGYRPALDRDGDGIACE